MNKMKSSNPKGFGGVSRWLWMGLCLFSMAASAVEMVGAGATFPYPLFAKWAAQYRAETNHQVNYQGIGSGGGIKQIIAKTVDFGSSDRPMTKEEQDKNGLIQFPSTMGGVAVVYNLPGVASGWLKLDAAVLSAIFLGEIKTWDDPRIVALNPGVKLPKLAITVVYRADGSGTSFLFTNYLSGVSAAWKARVGEGTSVTWPVGMGGKGNSGVAAYIGRLPGAIGYMEYAFANQKRFAMAALKNADGKFVPINPKTVATAAYHARWEKANGFYMILNNQPGAMSWPIVGVNFVLMQKVQDNPATGGEVIRFFNWGFTKGKAAALALGYVPLPDHLVLAVRQSWKENLRNRSGQPIY